MRSPPTRRRPRTRRPRTPRGPRKEARGRGRRRERGRRRRRPRKWPATRANARRSRPWTLRSRPGSGWHQEGTRSHGGHLGRQGSRPRSRRQSPSMAFDSAAMSTARRSRLRPARSPRRKPTSTCSSSRSITFRRRTATSGPPMRWTPLVRRRRLVRSPLATPCSRRTSRVSAARNATTAGEAQASAARKG